MRSPFLVRGVTVSFGGTVSFVGGQATDLLIGSKVDVHGALASDGVTLNATSIRFEH
jgi:hypothetical protein